tara:strand:+ start:2617 stop:3600 length:984 start_codon:yes stop_codon:yes gene_type:complete
MPQVQADPIQALGMSSTWAAVPFRDTWDRQVRQRALSWPQLVEHLTSFTVSHKGKGEVPAWSPTRYREGAKRGKADVLALSCLVLDYDSGTTIQTALNSWSWRPGILHTSWSHTEDHHRFRVILPLAEPVPAEDWGGVFSWADRWTRRCTNESEIQTPEDYHRATWESTIDTKCKDTGRLYYLPAVRAEDWPRFSTAWGGYSQGADGSPAVYLGAHTPWSRELTRHRQQVAESQRRRSAPRVRTQHRNPVLSYSAERDALKRCPQARAELGATLGGKLGAEQVRRVPCPSCGRSSVWWQINPDSRATASCDHRNSCGWYGHLDTLKP